MITDCIFLNNKAFNEGGAIFLINSDTDLKNSKFSFNSAAIGGAIRYTKLTPYFIYKYNY